MENKNKSVKFFENSEQFQTAAYCTYILAAAQKGKAA
jgi:hypothetical protein